jgi:hypothetical protein
MLVFQTLVEKIILMYVCRKWALGQNFDKEIVKFVQFFKD